MGAAKDYYYYLYEQHTFNGNKGFEYLFIDELKNTLWAQKCV